MDKNTANKLVLEKERKNEKKDNRHLYLLNEGKIIDSSSIPLADKKKRDNADNEARAKIKSPLFFVNPVRLSVKNLNKKPNEAVDNIALKKLFLDAAEKGLRLIKENEGDRSLFPVGKRKKERKKE